MNKFRFALVLISCLASIVTEPAHAQSASTADSAPWWWAALIAPLLTGLVGVGVGYLAIRFDLRKAVNQELIRKRLLIYDDMGPKLNELYCFFRCRGAFRDLSPELIIQRKRELDKSAYVYEYLFSTPLRDKYHLLIRTCFKPFSGGAGHDALLLADRSWLQSEWGDAWANRWNKLFIDPPTEASKQSDIESNYKAVMAQFAMEVGVRRRTSWLGALTRFRGS